MSFRLLVMEQLSKEQAQAIFKSRVWVNWTDLQILRFQLFQTHLVMPFGKYHTTLERCLGRPIYTYTLEFQKEKLIKEFLGTNQRPTFDEILSMIPDEVLLPNTLQV
jgi:hypothetical protein